jgi:hypothetical protein
VTLFLKPAFMGLPVLPSVDMMGVKIHTYRGSFYAACY